MMSERGRAAVRIELGWRGLITRLLREAKAETTYHPRESPTSSLNIKDHITQATRGNKKEPNSHSRVSRSSLSLLPHFTSHHPPTAQLTAAAPYPLPHPAHQYTSTSPSGSSTSPSSLPPSHHLRFHERCCCHSRSRSHRHWHSPPWRLALAPYHPRLRERQEDRP